MSARARDADKISAAVRDLRSRGVWAASAAPPLFRLLWRLGVSLPPPHFMTFGQTMLVCGAGYAAMWMLFEWLIP